MFGHQLQIISGAEWFVTLERVNRTNSVRWVRLGRQRVAGD